MTRATRVRLVSATTAGAEGRSRRARGLCGSMADDRPAKLAKLPPGPLPWRHKHGPNAYVAEVVSLGEVWRVMQAGAGPDAVVAWVADRQLGLITTPQLHVGGVSRGSVEWRLATGTLHRRHRGVYLVGHPVSPPGADELGAVLAVGRATFVSHRSAVALWGLAAPPVGEVEVTVVGRNCKSRAALRVHRAERLAPADRTKKHGVPVTSPARTAIDYAATASREEAERAIAEAFARRIMSQPQLVAALDRAPNRAGVAQVRAILNQPGGAERTRSGADARCSGCFAPRACRYRGPTIRWPASPRTSVGPRSA